MTVKVRVQDIGGVLMLRLPEQILSDLALESGSEINVSYGDETLKMNRTRRRYQLQDLLEQCDAGAGISEEDRQWERIKPVGRELL